MQCARRRAKTSYQPSDLAKHRLGLICSSLFVDFEGKHARPKTKGSIHHDYHCHPMMCWRDWQVNAGCVLLCHIKAATGRMLRSFGFSVICGLRLVCSANSGQVSSAGGQFWVEKPDNQLKSSPGATRGGLWCPCLVDLPLPLVQPCTLGLYGLLPLFYALAGCWTHWDAVLLPAWLCT